MRTFASRCPRLGVLSALALGALVLLSACGSFTAIGSNGTAPTPTATPTVPPISAQGDGCLSDQAPTGPAFHPDATVTQGQPATVTLTTGQRLEVRLSQNIRWGLALSDPNQSLTPVTPESWRDPQTNQCVWRYLAARSGQAELTFTGVFACKPPLMCPAIAEAMSVEVTVR